MRPGASAPAQETSASARTASARSRNRAAVDRTAAVIPVEEVASRDFEDPCKGEKTFCREAADPFLVFGYLVIADTELPGQLLLGQTGAQAQLLDPKPEEPVNIRTRGSAHRMGLVIVHGA